MSKRHEAIGIKQVIRLEWMDKTVNLLLSGLDKKSIRKELHNHLSGTKGSGASGERGNTSRSQVVNILMNIWVTPDSDIETFRDACLAMIQDSPRSALPVHWAMISAAYPFWFNVAIQVGRLLALQDQVTQAQIFNRLKEQYGDRETVSRYARYTVRSFIAWGVLSDTKTKGCYQSNLPNNIEHNDIAALLIESYLLASTTELESKDKILHSPAFFYFKIPPAYGSLFINNDSRIEVVQSGLNDVMLKVKTNHLL